MVLLGLRWLSIPSVPMPDITRTSTVCSNADAEYETTFRNLIESRHLVRQEDWIA
jgi:hypothetical protein